MAIRPLIKYFGGKHYLAKRLISCFPPKFRSMTYKQPCIGGGNPFLQKDKSVREIISDLNFNIVNLWSVVKNDCERLMDTLCRIPYCEASFDYYSSKEFNSEFDKAVQTFVKYRMSRSGRGDSFSWSDRLRGGQPESINAYETAISNLDLVSKRLANTEIKIETCWDSVNDADDQTFVYLDPPYRKETRNGFNVYELEMSDEDHIKLALACRKSRAKIMISHYDDPFYNDVYKNWRKVSFSIVNNSSEKQEKDIKKEVIWMNY